MLTDLSAEITEVRKDEHLLNNFIESNKHFILTTAYRTTGRFVTDSDDAYSIALIAFHEAVQSYEPDKGNFYSFAALVIKRRLLDHIRSESRFSSEISVEPSAMGGSVDDEAPQAALQREVQRKEWEISQQNRTDQPEGSPIRDEIAAVQDILQRYGFSFFDLADCSPKAEKTKKACAEAVNYMLAHQDLIRKMQETGNLPGKELKQKAGVSTKIVERHRKYLIAAIEILNGDYPLLAEYISYIRKDLET